MMGPRLPGFDDALSMRARDVGRRAFGKVGWFMLGQLVMMAVVGVTVGVDFAIAGIPYAVPLATIAGLLAALPEAGGFDDQGLAGTDRTSDDEAAQ